MLDAVGDDAVVAGAVIGILFYRAGEVVDLGGSPVVAVDPLAVARAADVAACSIVGGTSITISGHDYTVLSVTPDGDGFYTLRLEEAE